MRFLLLFLLLVNAKAFAGTQASCEVVDGIYRNSTETIQEIKFETLVDVFTINNAKTLSFRLEQENMKLLRSDLDIGRQTKMIYLLKKNDRTIRFASILLDRTPREVNRTKEFYGNIVLSAVVNEKEIALGNYSGNNLVYNFYCRF